MAQAALVGALLAAIAPSGAGAQSPAVAHSSRTLNVTDTGRLHYNARESEGATLVEEGSAKGALPGRMKAHLTIEASFTGNFVLYTNGGSIKGHGSAKPSGSGRYESFRGSLTVTGGTGRYAHAHGQAGLYGVFDRKTYALTVQTTGRLSY
jgi:hypothetical protein